MTPFSWLRKLIRSECGNALVICAATLPLVIGAAAVGVDTIQVSVARRQLQRAADSAALAGAYAKHNNHDIDVAVAHDLTLNDDVALSDDAVVENAPTVGDYAGDARAVRVVLTAERGVPFWSLFGGETMTVTTEATARAVVLGEYCMVSLEDTAVTGITFTGNSSLTLGCGVVSNSTANNAVTASGSATIFADPVAAVGGVPASNNYASGTNLLPYTSPQDDPFADLPTPTVPSDCNNGWIQNPNQDPPALTPTASGVYCYRGMTFKGTVTMPSGVYIIDGSDLDFSSQANVTCDGCTFILTSRNAATNPSQIAGITMNGGAVVNLTAPDTGTYQGVLIYQDRRANYATETINGNSGSTIEGALYFPTAKLEFKGTSGMNIACMQLVARRLEFSGATEVSNTCPAGSGSDGFEALFIRLVA